MPEPLILLSGVVADNKRAIIHLDDETATKVGPRTYRKRILRYGKWHHAAAPGGILDVSPEYGAKLVANFNEGVWDTAAVTHGHPKDEKDGTLLSTGEVLGLEQDADGVWGIVKVSADTATKIDAGEIKGCSAGLIDNYVDHEVNGRGEVGPVLAHLALTNEPYIKGLGDFAPVQLADEGEAVLLSPVDPKEEVPMDRAELLAAAKTAGIDIEALEASAAKVTDLEAKLAAAPTTETVVEEATAAAQGELVAALGEALVGAQVITLAEGETPNLASVVKAITSAVADGKTAQATLLLSEAEGAVDAAIRSGKAVPAKRDALVKLALSDRATFDALLPDEAIVPLGERGHSGIDLEEPNGGAGLDHAAEIDRLAALADAL